jgi:hypothetical protein
MDKEVSIVLSVERKNYRKLAQEWYGLTDEQMVDMDVHHNPSRHKGGRNIPEHLFVYHNTLHHAVHGYEYILWARKGSPSVKNRNSAPGGKASCALMKETQTGFFDPKHKERKREGSRKAGEKRAHRMKEEGYPGLGSSFEAASVAGKKAAAQRWEDPDHPELGLCSAGILTARQKRMGYPHGPENRRKIK